MTLLARHSGGSVRVLHGHTETSVALLNYHEAKSLLNNLKVAIAAAGKENLFDLRKSITHGEKELATYRQEEQDLMRDLGLLEEPKEETPVRTGKRALEVK